MAARVDGLAGRRARSRLPDRLTRRRLAAIAAIVVALAAVAYAAAGVLVYERISGVAPGMGATGVA